ncbi:PD-(D/E)XK nuclease family protein [Streptobacillus moniliformis]|uniref:PD-(D/E)XK nuclease family protein n=1 Tax=Streptobacillus moniliformis TaxID=34105 RepID=UPI0007E2E085|nr:PD-(D/E)XK nuclease family protein [Streptobacillus moniliformis]
MALKFEYKGIDFNLNENTVDNTLYVFSNFNDKFEIENNDKDIFTTKKYITETEFWEKIILTKKILLKEEKEVVYFFNSLDDELKKKLQINSYFDCIDIAYRYYSFMREYIEYGIDLDKITIHEWQKKIINIYLEINDIMLEKSKKEDKIPRYLLPVYSYINTDYINSFKNIVFVNKFSYNVFEKKILEDIDNLSIYLFVDKNDYDEEKNILKNITIPNLKDKKIKIVECSDKYSQILNIIDNIEFNIFYDMEEKKIDEIKPENVYINQNEIANTFDFSFNKTVVYNIVSKIHAAINNGINGKYLISDIYNLYTIKEFKKEFNISENDINTLFRESKYGNIYINSEKIKSLKFLDEMKGYKSKEEYLEKLTKIGNIKSSKEYMFNTSFTYFEALTEVNVLDFSFLNNFSSEYLKLFLKYLDRKSLHVGICNNNSKILDIKKLSTGIKENFALINVQGNIFSKDRNIFSKIQSSELGLHISDNLIYENLYNIYRNIVMSNNIYISYIKNEDENISEMPFLTELMFNNNLKAEKKEVTMSEKANILNQLLDKSNIRKVFNPVYLTNNDIMHKNELLNDFNKISVTKLLSLINSEIEYYLSSKIEESDIYNEDIESVEVGNITHNIMELMINKVGKNINHVKKNELLEYIKEAISNVINQKDNNILEKYKKYFYITYINDLPKTILDFFDKLKKVLIHENIVDVYSEKVVEFDVELEDRIIKVNGKTDLVVETEDKYIIIDFKTGKFKKEKMKVYANQVTIYSYMNEFKDKEKVGYISFIQTFDSLKEIDVEKAEVNKDIIKEVLNNFVTGDVFEFGKEDKYSKFKEVIKYGENENSSKS